MAPPQLDAAVFRGEMGVKEAVEQAAGLATMAERLRLKGTHPAAINITIEPRGDGGIRVWSADLPGLILSGAPDLVSGDIVPALRVLSDAFDAAIRKGEA